MGGTGGGGGYIPLMKLGKCLKIGAKSFNIFFYSVSSEVGIKAITSILTGYPVLSGVNAGGLSYFLSICRVIEKRNSL